MEYIAVFDSFLGKLALGKLAEANRLADWVCPITGHTMRDSIQLSINGNAVAVTGGQAFMTLAEFLRQRCRLTGTKIVCAEGDCGSCTVLCSRPGGDGAAYQPIDSCIRFMFQLDGASVVTVEGLQQNGELNATQQAMIDCHGSQCGFCTPGFVVAMTAFQESLQAVDQPGIAQSSDCDTTADLRAALTGNLCRCTGYTPIIEAGLKCAAAAQTSTPRALPEVAANGQSQRPAKRESIEISAEIRGQKQRVFVPADLSEATTIYADHPTAKIVAGATDVGVRFNKGFLNTTDWIDLGGIDELRQVSLDTDQLELGATVTWTQVASTTKDRLAEFHRIVEVFGAPQIRHVGTVGGNIMNASPIADALPFLFVCAAQLTLASHTGERTLDINDFYKGYKQLDIQPGELLTKVTIPLPPASRHLRLYKISRRRDLDISSFTAAVWVDLTGDEIVDAGIAYGAVGPTVLRLEQTEQFLRGKSFSLDTMIAAGDLAVKEISPISDVRGSDRYRLQLARNVLKKFFYQIQNEQTPQPVA